MALPFVRVAGLVGTGDVDSSNQEGRRRRGPRCASAWGAPLRLWRRQGNQGAESFEYEGKARLARRI